MATRQRKWKIKLVMKSTNMVWEKKGLIFVPGSDYSKWIKNYAALPVCDLLENKRLRIYFSTRDDQGRSLLTFIEVDAEDPSQILYVHDKPVLQLGPQGSFDDNGIMPSSIVTKDKIKYLFYIGWNPQVTVSYRLSIGLAISYDDGITFEKYSLGPICDRDKDEPYFNTAPFVIFDKDVWKMWYVSCTGWKNIKDWPEPFYLIRYAESKDGIVWERKKTECIGYDDFTHAIGKPYVFKEQGIYKMFYSYRNSVDYRIDSAMSYRFGYAESLDGVVWTRQDDKMDLKSNCDKWEDVMQEYGSSYVFMGKRYLIYNGNGFGATGFGYAVLKHQAYE